jgi:hypothetical protein
MSMTKKIPSYSEQNPHPTAVIREMRYLIRNSIAFHAPIAEWCFQSGLIEESAAMSGVKYKITEIGRQYIEQHRDYDPEPD